MIEKTIFKGICVIRAIVLFCCVILVSSSCSSRRKNTVAKETAPQPPTDLVCKSSREYITTLEYLRDKKAFALSEAQSKEMALKVSGGCTDASKRFIETTDLLVKAEMDSRKVFDYSLKMALASNEASQTFQKVFKESFVQDLLDLDLFVALDTAYQLSFDFSGNYSDLSNDFNYLVRFCVDQKSLGLPIKECAQFATRIARIGSQIRSPVSETFRKGFEFLTRPDKSNLPTVDALKTLERILPFGGQGLENFTQAYDYATSEKGLALPIKQGIEFALVLTSKTKQ